MKAYLDIVRKVLEEGIVKENRTGIDTLVCPFVPFEHNMQEGFPLLTTKKMPIKTIAVELEGFLKGITSKSWYQERGCKIWNEWANPEVVDRILQESQLSVKPTKKELQERLDDLGPIYGYQWRRFNQVYDENDGGTLDTHDQLGKIILSLRDNKNDRRMVCSAWNPEQISKMALPPCHILWNVVVINDTLNLGWYQRSCDLMLGVPFNIASYGLLLELLAKQSDLKPGKLFGVLADCHIYQNQIEVAREQISREPKELPRIEIKNKPFEIENNKLEVIWTHKDVNLINYLPYEKLNFGPVAV